jgi:hypothetical protein
MARFRRGRRSRARLGVAAAALVAMAATVIGTDPAGANSPYIILANATLADTVLTSYSGDTNSVDIVGPDTVVTARWNNDGGNLRFFFWAIGAEESRDQQVCATWQHATGSFQQQGVVLRAVSSATGTRAISVTKNVWLGAFWKFNVHLWDTSVTDSPFTQSATFDLASVLHPGGRLAPLPWRICARAVADVVSFKVWSLTRAEPAWGDPAYGGRVTVPAQWVYPGMAGQYAGHVQPGDSMSYRNLTTTELPPPDPQH